MDRLTLLKQISFGARVAEDETNELASYFVETDQWERIARGEVDVIRGDKGAGKSAIYSLLITRADHFFDQNILLVSAEKPRGTPVFSNLIAQPPTSEADFIALWKLYLVSIVAEKIRDFEIGGDDARKLIDVLVNQGLLEGEFDLARLLRKVVDYAKRWAVPELEPTVTIDQNTGATTLGMKIRPGEVSSDTQAVSVNNLLEMANRALGSSGRKVWVLLDRLDVAFAENHILEANALRALFRVYRDLANLENIRIKIFIRTDIWKRITEGGFREASHITRFVILDWSPPALLNLMMRRFLSNRPLLEVSMAPTERRS